MNIPHDKYIVLFDGECNLCNDRVDFLMKRDRKNDFLFGSLQSDKGQRILKHFDLPVEDFDSFVLVNGDRYWKKSTAALVALQQLGAGWKFLATIGFIFPVSFRDTVYDYVASNRYNWFGKRETCRMPTEEELSKFL